MAEVESTGSTCPVVEHLAQQHCTGSAVQPTLSRVAQARQQAVCYRIGATTIRITRDKVTKHRVQGTRTPCDHHHSTASYSVMLISNRWFTDRPPRRTRVQPTSLV